MPSKSKTAGKIRPISPVTAKNKGENVVEQPSQATTEMGVPIAPDQLFEVSEGLYASLFSLKVQIEQLQNLIGEKAHAAAMALGAKGDSQIVLSNDMRFLAVYEKASIERANKEAIEKAMKEAPVDGVEPKEN